MIQKKHIKIGCTLSNAVESFVKLHIWEQWKAGNCGQKTTNKSVQKTSLPHTILIWFIPLLAHFIVLKIFSISRQEQPKQKQIMIKTNDEKW